MRSGWRRGKIGKGGAEVIVIMRVWLPRGEMALLAEAAEAPSPERLRREAWEYESRDVA